MDHSLNQEKKKEKRNAMNESFIQDWSKIDAMRLLYAQVDELGAYYAIDHWTNDRIVLVEDITFERSMNES